MRNLALLGVTRLRLSLGSGSFISATTLDLDENVVYIASERGTDESIEVDVWKSVQRDSQEVSMKAVMSLVYSC